MTTTNIKVAILEDHQSIVDGYLYRLSTEPRIQVVATISYGEDIEPTLAQVQADVLLLDVQVPTSESNPNPYPILHSISILMKSHPGMNILAISMHTQAVLIQALIDAGVSGYIYKDDYASIKQLARIISIVANGGVYFSQAAHRQLQQGRSEAARPLLSPRQIEVLSLCASYADDSTEELAKRLDVAGSTLRNLLSNAYVRLGVHTRAAAIAKVQKIGLIPNSANLD